MSKLAVLGILALIAGTHGIPVAQMNKQGLSIQRLTKRETAFSRKWNPYDIMLRVTEGQNAMAWTEIPGQEKLVIGLDSHPRNATKITAPPYVHSLYAHALK